MTHTIDTNLFAVAANLGPLIAEQSATGERDRRVPQAVLDALRDAGLFRLLVPRSLGGVETDPVTCAHIIEEVLRFDSATGWTLQTANPGAEFRRLTQEKTPFMSATAVRECPVTPATP